MDWPTQNPTVHRTWRVYSESSVAYKTLIAIFFVVLFQKLISKPKKYKLFPIWATIEIAVASYILRGDGLGRQIL
jgi:hypothetical protein